jgi:hypothetical protein
MSQFELTFELLSSVGNADRPEVGRVGVAVERGRRTGRSSATSFSTPVTPARMVSRGTIVDAVTAANSADRPVGVDLLNGRSVFREKSAVMYF